MHIKSFCAVLACTLIWTFSQGQEKIFPVAQEMPTIEGCEEIVDYQERYTCGQDKIKAFIADNLKYPKEALKAGQEGYAIVSFIVTAEGDVEEITVAEDPGFGMGDAATKVVKKMSKMWVAGKNKGQPVSVRMRVPVMFRLPETDEKEETTPETPDVYFVVDDMPRFEGCGEVDIQEARSCTFQKLTKFVMDNMKYPEEAREEGVEGTVITDVIIDTEGNLTDATVVESVGHGCDEEALRLLEAMPVWIPGKHDGKAVKVRMQLPFRFRLPNQDD